MLFQKTIVNKYKQALPKEITNQPWEAFQQYFLNKDIQQNILQSKEEQFQEGFLRELIEGRAVSGGVSPRTVREDTGLHAQPIARL